jgi:hypothetical protein
MQLQIQHYSLKQIICQVRYKRGYRYLDVCGATMASIEEQYPAWTLQNATLQNGAMFNAEDSITLAFSSFDMSVSQQTEEIQSGEQIISSAGLLFPIIVTNIKLDKFERMGIRFYDFHACNSCADAFNFVEQNKLLRHDAITALLGDGRSTTRTFVAKRENETTGIRLQVSVVRRTGNEFADEIAYTELLGTVPKQKPGAKETPKYGVLFDIDVFEKDPIDLSGIAEFMKRGMEERQNIIRSITKEAI